MKNSIKRDFIKNIYCNYNSLLPFLPVFRDKISDFIITDDDEITKTASIRFFQNSYYSITLNKKFIIEFDLNSEDIMWLIAHEISHYLLGHFDYSDRSNFINFIKDMQVNSLLYNINSRKNIDLFIKTYKNFYDQMNDNPKMPSKIMNILLFPPFKKRKDIEKELKKNKLLSNKKTEKFISLWFDNYSVKGLNCSEISYRLEAIFDIKKIDLFYIDIIQSNGLLNEKLKERIQEKFKEIISRYLHNFQKHSFFKHNININNSLLNKKDIKKLKILKNAITKVFTDNKNYRTEVEKEVFFNSVIPFYSRKQIALLNGGCTPLFFPNSLITKALANKFSAIYIDFSGSVDHFKAKIYFLLNELKDFFKGPYFLFSTKIKKITLADIKTGKAITGGTDIDVVLTHINNNKFTKALIITDGYFHSPEIVITAEIYEILIGQYHCSDETHSKLIQTGKLIRSWVMQ